MNLIYHEIKKLICEYYKCDHPEIKEMILSDIQLLNEALVLSKLPPYCINGLSKKKKTKPYLP